MKKSIILVILTAILILNGCSVSTGNVNKSEIPKESAENAALRPVDVDITEKMYITYINEIYTNTSDYVGKKIKIKGMYKNETVGPNTYHYVYRTGPGCCGNDGATCGFEFTYKGTMPKVGDWVEVTGILRTYVENEKTYLSLTATSINPCDAEAPVVSQ